MDSRYVLIGVGVVAVAAAFGGGYYLSHSGNPPPPAPIAQTQAPAQVAETPAPAATVGTPQTPAPSAPAKTTAHSADYASGETEYAAPPPPPPPREIYRDRPSPFEGHFTTFPMRHSGRGTIDSPLTWTAQTEWAHGREADLRISILVPEPSPNDRGTFWREWGRGDRGDLIPELTRGTPVIVTGSISVIVAVDPDFLDLEVPAVLFVSGRDGQRIYRSNDVAPARGEAWDSRGARWIFEPDADFYRMLRNGADVALAVPTRDARHQIRIPFATDDFPFSARQFEHVLVMRLNDIASGWDRARPGRPYPLPPAPVQPVRPPIAPPAAQMTQTVPPVHPHGPGAGRPIPPQPQPVTPGHAPVVPPAAQMAHTVQPVPSHGPGAVKPNPLQPVAPGHTPVVPPAGQMAHTVQPVPSHGPGAVKPNPPTSVAVVPGRPPVAQPATTPAIPARDAARAAMISAYRPPVDDCGAQPPYPTSNPTDYAGYAPPKIASARIVLGKVTVWMNCRTRWIANYGGGISTLERGVADPGQQPLPALQAAKGGPAIVVAYQKARLDFADQQKVYSGHMAAFTQAASKPAAPTATPQPAKVPAAKTPVGQPAGNHGKPLGAGGQTP